jgi:ring-1,2-phenylacetyl-CoA epoxidase subunit PaaE
MSPRFHRLDIAEVRRETPDAVSIAFAVPDNLRDAYLFAAGQHVTVKMTLDGEEVRRSYSICAGIGDGELRIAVKKQPHGVFSRFANEHLAAGDALEVMTPSGHFTLPPEGTGARTYLGLVCGSGITPMLSLIKTALAREPQSRFFLLYGNRTTESILFRQQLEDLKDRFMGRLSLTHVLSREAQDVPFMSGRIDAEKIALYLRRVIPAAAADLAFVCGPPAMIETAEQALLAAGLARERIRIERFTTGEVVTPARVAALPAETPAPSDAIAEADAILDGVRRHFPIAAGQTVIDAALAAGIELPYSCRGGMCCTCRAKLVEGEVKMDVNYSLEPWELTAGYVLTCQSRPQSKTLVLDYDHL